MPAALDAIHTEVEAWFLKALDELTSRAWALSRGLRPVEREEAVAETIAWAWALTLSAGRRGRLDRLTPRTLAIFGVRMFRSGRRFAGSSCRCVLSEQTRLLNRVRVQSLHDDNEDREERAGGRSAFRALADRRATQPIDSARIRVDYPLALADPTLPSKAPQCFDELALDYGPGHGLRVAKALDISPARVCQLKNSLAGALSRIGYDPHASPDAA